VASQGLAGKGRKIFFPAQTMDKLSPSPPAQTSSEPCLSGRQAEVWAGLLGFIRQTKMNGV